MLEVFQETLRQLQAKASINVNNIDEDDSLQEQLQHILAETKVDGETKLRLEHEYLGAGPIEKLLVNESITEILITRETIFFEQDGVLQAWQDQFLSDLTYENFVQRLSQDCLIQADLNTPFANGSWRGFRVHIVGPPICPRGFQISLRRKSGTHWTLQRLEEYGFCNKQELQVLLDSLQEKKNILVVGPTGSGKTTLLNCLLAELPLHCRVILIEDTDELNLPNLVSTKLLTRSDSKRNLREYTQQDLLKESLRMRPDRIVVGEVRGAEAKDLLMALATGHSGSFGTLHARSAKEALWRLEMLVQMGAPQWSLDTIRRLIQVSIDMIIVVDKQEGKRQLKELSRISSLESFGFLLEPINNQLHHSYQTLTSR